MKQDVRRENGVFTVWLGSSFRKATTPLSGFLEGHAKTKKSVILDRKNKLEQQTIQTTTKAYWALKIIQEVNTKASHKSTCVSWGKMTLVYSKQYYDLHKKLNHLLGSWQTIRDLTLKILEWLTGQPKRYQISKNDNESPGDPER